MVWSTCIYTCTHQHMVTQSSQGWHPEDCFPRVSVTCLKIQWLLQLYCSWTLWWFWNFYTSSRLKAFLIYLGSPPVFFSTLLKFPLLDVFYTHSHTHLPSCSSYICFLFLPPFLKFILTASGLHCGIWDLVPWSGVEPRVPCIGIMKSQPLDPPPPQRSPHFLS